MKPTVAEIDRLAQQLADGGVIGFPTETVYAIGASLRRLDAIRRIYEIKRRPPGRPLIVHVAETEGLDAFGQDVPPWARRAASALWPGPLTLVVRANAQVPRVAIGGGHSVGLRVPDHSLARALMRALARAERTPIAGLVGTSANDYDAAPATTAEQVRADLDEQLAGVLDGGPCAFGIESTVVADRGGRPQILRPGAIDAQTLGAACGEAVGTDPLITGDVAKSVLLVDAEALRGAVFHAADVVLASWPIPDSFLGARWIELPAPLDQRAQRLFTALRSIDPSSRVWAELAPESGVGTAINARLRRWAASRDAQAR